MHLVLWYVVFVFHQYDVCKTHVGSVYVGGYGGLSGFNNYLIINIEKDLIRINRIHIRQCVRTNGIPANESRDLFTVTYELMCVILNFACLDNHMNYLKKSYRVKKCILLNIL